ncbi:MAG: putative zinc-binding protein [Methanomassiliicoccales archaeon]
MSEECEYAHVLVYSCSGGSNVGQMANEMTKSLGRIENVNMSCLAGIGGDISTFTESARAAKGAVAIDGCGVACALKTMTRHGLRPTVHHVLTENGTRKNHDLEETDGVDRHLSSLLVEMTDLGLVDGERDRQ